MRFFQKSLVFPNGCHFRKQNPEKPRKSWRHRVPLLNFDKHNSFHLILKTKYRRLIFSDNITTTTQYVFFNQSTTPFSWFQRWANILPGQYSSTLLHNLIYQVLIILTSILHNLLRTTYHTTFPVVVCAGAAHSLNIRNSTCVSQPVPGVNLKQAQLQCPE